MPRKAQTKHGPGGKYYRKRIKKPDGGYVDVYGRTLVELEEKVTLKQNELAAAESPPPAEIYFFEYASGWYAKREGSMSAGMRKMYKFQINKVICPVIGGKKLQEINSDDLQAVLATRAQLSRSSQNKTVLVLKQIFDAALEADKISKLPTRQLKAKGKPSPQKKALTEAQQSALLDAVRGLAVEPCVILGLYTGMRREEICGLRWDCVELSGSAPHVTVKRACRWPTNAQPVVSEDLKSAAGARVIPIPPQLVHFLNELKEKQNKKPAQLRKLYVYGDADGKPISFTTFRRRWETIKTRSTASGKELGAKIRNKKYTITLDFYPTPHTLRHTYITRLILGGMDLKRVQYLAGHADPKVTLQIYTDLMGHRPEDLIDDVTAIFAAGEKGK